MTPAGTTRARHDQAKLNWLRHAVQQGLDEIARGQGIEFASLDELEQSLNQIGDEASAAVAVKGGRG